jgi:hypothetical protein
MLDAGGSNDSDGSIVDYAWDLDGDLLFEASGPAASISHAFTATGPVTVRVRVLDNGGLTDVASVVLTVAAPVTPPPGPGAGPGPGPADPDPQPQPQPQPDPAPGPAPDLGQPFVVPNALTAGASAPAAAPTFSVPGGQRLKRQRGVRVKVTCSAACEITLGGSVKVGARKLHLKALKASLGAGRTQTLTVKVADATALKKAKGKAKAAVKVTATSGGQTTIKSLSGSLTA